MILEEKIINTTVNSKLSADEINNFYCSIAKKLSDKITPKCDPLKYLNNFSVLESFFLAPTDTHEIREILNDIKNKNTSGWDCISLKIFLKLPDNILQILVEAINTSFETGTFPSCLKIAEVVPLFKSGDHDSPSNYRPVSLLPTLSKIIEKLVKKRILDFLHRNKVLCAEQFGFHASKSTNDAIFAFLEKLYLQINDGEVAAAVFCDLAKAFDCVNHGILLRKLETYGFRGKTLDWFKSYLSGRYQKVIFNGKVSKQLEVNSGVPQGSVLGPLLFLIYFNDLASVKIQGKFTFFADDTTILWHGKYIDELHEIVSSDLGMIKEWCDANLLSFNVSKTNIITFKCNLNEIYLEDKIIKNQTECRFLGLHIDSKLKFENHISILSKKLAANCFAIRVVANELKLDSARNAYFALIDSHLRYGICFWGSCSQYLFNKIFVLQKRALKYMRNAPCTLYVFARAGINRTGKYF